MSEEFRRRSTDMQIERLHDTLNLFVQSTEQILHEHKEDTKLSLEEHKYVIERNREDNKEVKGMLLTHIESEESAMKDLAEKLEPMYDVWQEVGAFSKFMSKAKTFSLWVAGLGAALAGFNEYIQHLTHNKP